MLKYDNARVETLPRPAISPEAASLAALALGESLVYTLVEEGLVDKDAVQDALQDAIDGQRISAQGDLTRSHRVAIKLLERIMDALEFADDGRSAGRASR